MLLMDTKSILQNLPSKKVAKSPLVQRYESPLRELIVKTYRTDPKRISADLGVTRQYIERLSDPNSDFRYSARLMLPSMLASKNTSILSWMAEELGFSVYKLPKILRHDDLENIRNIFIDTATGALKEIAKNNILQNKEEVVEQLNWLIAVSVRMRAALKKGT